jgi:hypothetical protein
MTDAHKTIEYRGFTIEIMQDDICDNPRGWDNLGIMACFHRRYILGDSEEHHGLSITGSGSWERLDEHLEKERDARIVLPIYIYDHSGITINTSGFSCPWDSGRVGVIFATADNIRKWFSIKRITRKYLDLAEQCLRDEVKAYDQHLTGEVYWFRLFDPDGEIVASCGGYYGYPEGMKMIESECKGMIDLRLEADEKKKISGTGIIPDPAY